MKAAPPSTGPWPQQHRPQEDGQTRPALALEFALGPDGRTQLARAYRRYPWSLTRAFHLDAAMPGLATVLPQAVSGIVLGGDRVAAQVRVGEGASARLAFAGAQVVQPGRGGGLARLDWTVAVAPGAFVEVLMPPTVLRAGARLGATVRLEVAPGARVLWSEALTWQARACGTPGFARIETALEVWREGTRVAWERVALEPAGLGALQRDGRLPAALGQVIYLGEDGGAAMAALTETTETATWGADVYGGITALPHGAGLAAKLVGWCPNGLVPAREAVRGALWHALFKAAPSPRYGTSYAKLP